MTSRNFGDRRKLSSCDKLEGEYCPINSYYANESSFYLSSDFELSKWQEASLIPWRLNSLGEGQTTGLGVRRDFFKRSSKKLESR